MSNYAFRTVYNKQTMRQLLKWFPQCKEHGIDYKKLCIVSDTPYSITWARDSYKLVCYIRNFLKQSENITITDATANVGGDTIQFGLNFAHVNSVEISPDTHKALNNNIGIYKLQNVKTFCNSYVNIGPKLVQDVVYIDAPWGGPKYKEKTKLMLYLDNLSLAEICNKIVPKCTRLIVCKVPYNFDFEMFLRTIKYSRIHVQKMTKYLLVFITV